MIENDKILLYMSRIFEICLYCTLYMRKICKVKCTYTFVHERKIEFMYNPGYRMKKMHFYKAENYVLLKQVDKITNGNVKI